jgi:hypothetical protein
VIEFLLYVVGTPTWLVGGAFTARRAIAYSERHYLALAQRAYEEDRRYMPQDKMDADDWVGAGVFALGAFVFFPLVVVGWGVKKVLGAMYVPLRPLYRPFRSFFVPPVQREFEEHVEQLDNHKALMLQTASTYRDVLGWKPDNHPDRVQMIAELEKQLAQQMEDLFAMTDPNRAYDGNFKEILKEEIKELTR